jgi:flagellar assembly protein FliH
MSSELFGRAANGPAPILWRVIGSDGAPQPHVPPHLLEQKFQEGRQRGLADAAAIARRDAEAQLQPVLERLAREIGNLAECRKRVREETTAELVRLSVAIAARILHREITIDPSAVQGLIQAAFEKVQAREGLRIFIHPSHEAAVRGFIEQSGAAQKLEIVADAALACGDLRIETSQGDLDASIDTQLREVERGLADRLHT